MSPRLRFIISLFILLIFLVPATIHLSQIGKTSFLPAPPTCLFVRSNLSTPSIENISVISLNISLFYVNSGNVTLNYENGWTFRNVYISYFRYDPIGFNIFEGYYNEENISNACPIPLKFNYFNSPITIPPCPPKCYVFSHCDRNMTAYWCLGQEYESIRYGAEISFLIAKNLSVLSAYSTSFVMYGNFKPGIFTVAVGDEWGNMNLSYVELNHGIFKPI